MTFLSVILLLSGSSPAVSTTQTDWSGGPGTYGPLNSWFDDFGYDTDTRWYSDPGRLEIDPGFMRMVDSDFKDPGTVCAHDVDGDFDMDILAVSGDWEGSVRWWENVGGTGESWAVHTIADDFDYGASVCSRDIDNDNDMDVVGASFLGPTAPVKWWENADGSGTSWTEHTIDLSFEAAWSVRSEDFNGDGAMDVLCASSWGDTCLAWWENADGSGISWSQHDICTDLTGLGSIHSEDIDGDGDKDVIAPISSGLIMWWENADGSGTDWSEHLVAEDFEGAEAVFSADVDGDGDMDILGAALYDWGMAWWENTDGSGTSWVEHIIDDDFMAARSVFSEDLDDDGDMDVMGSGAAGYDIAWWENADGMGTAWVKHTVYGSFGGARSVYASDIDGDGQMDILSGAEYDDDVAWWDLGEYAPQASMESSILDVGCSPDSAWAVLSWNGSQPPGTGLYLQFRSSVDPDSMGEWSAPLPDPCQIGDQLRRYFAYRVVLETASPDTTPTIYDVTLSLDPEGIMEERGAHPSAIGLLPVVPNPLHGQPYVSFRLPERAYVDVSIFDIHGRLAEQVSEVYPEGEHTVQITRLAPGVYFLHMSTAQHSESAKFVVLE